MKLSKLQTFTALSMFALLSSQAHAVVMDGWERPISQAKMTIEKAEGSFKIAEQDNQPVKLIMTKQDGQRTPTGLMLLIDNQLTKFKVIKTETDSCGSRHYSAIRNNDLVALTSGGIDSIELNLVDHSNRNCRDIVRYGWEAKAEKVRFFRGDRQEVVGSLEVGGNPESVLSIMTEAGNPPAFSVNESPINGNEVTGISLVRQFR